MSPAALPAAEKRTQRTVHVKDAVWAAWMAAAKGEHTSVGRWLESELEKVPAPTAGSER